MKAMKILEKNVLKFLPIIGHFYKMDDDSLYALDTYSTWTTTNLVIVL